MLECLISANPNENHSNLQLEEKCRSDLEFIKQKFNREYEILLQQLNKELEKLHQSHQSELSKLNIGNEEYVRKLRKKLISRQESELRLFQSQQKKDYRHQKEANKTVGQSGGRS